MISPEGRILACAAALSVGPQHEDRLRGLMAGPVDGERLIEMAVREGLAGLLYRGLAQAETLESLGSAHRDRLQSLYYLTVVANVTLVHQLAAILEYINRENIQVVVLQGVALLQDVYRDPGLRPTTDIDLWVMPEDYAEVARILRSRGYAGDPLYATTFRKETTILDLHTHLFWADRIGARRRLIARDQRDLFQNTRIVSFAGREVRCLSSFDQVIHLTLHAFKHGVSRLVWLVDIMGLVSPWSRADWDGLLGRAKELGQEGAVSLLVFLLGRVFDFRPPVGALPSSDEVKIPALERWLLNLRKPGKTLPGWAHLVLLSTGKEWRTRLRIVAESLFPRPEVLRQVFPEAATRRAWGLYGKRVLQAFEFVARNETARVSR
jgi:Uncharacterised nucleotidyltransferase